MATQGACQRKRPAMDAIALRKAGLCGRAGEAAEESTEAKEKFTGKEATPLTQACAIVTGDESAERQRQETAMEAGALPPAGEKSI